MKKLQLLALSMLLSPAVATFASQQELRSTMQKSSSTSSFESTSEENRSDVNGANANDKDATYKELTERYTHYKDDAREAREKELLGKEKEMIHAYNAFATEDDNVEAKTKNLYIALANQVKEVTKEMSESKNPDRIVNLQNELEDLQGYLQNLKTHFTLRSNHLQDIINQLQSEVDAQTIKYQNMSQDPEFNNMESERGYFSIGRYDDLVECVNDKIDAIKVLQSKIDAQNSWNKSQDITISSQDKFANARAKFEHKKPSAQTKSIGTVLDSIKSNTAKKFQRSNSNTSNSSNGSDVSSSSKNEDQVVMTQANGKPGKK